MGVGEHTVLCWCAWEAGRISILVKKAASVVWLNTDSLEAHGRGRNGTQIELHFKQHLPPVCELM